MTRAELIVLRDDALTVIIELYRMPPAERLGTADRTFALQRAIALHNATCKQLDQWQVESGDADAMTEAVASYERLRQIEAAAVAFGTAFSRSAQVSFLQDDEFTTACQQLAAAVNLKGGA